MASVQSKDQHAVTNRKMYERLRRERYGDPDRLEEERPRWYTPPDTPEEESEDDG